MWDLHLLSISFIIGKTNTITWCIISYWVLKGFQSIFKDETYNGG